MKTQVNVRLSDNEVRQLDALRMEMAKQQGTIPTRSDVVRQAINELIKKYGSGQKTD